MSSVLDKSLDEILADKPKKTFKKKTVAKSKVTKATVAPKKAVKKTPKAAAPAAPAVLDASYATKVIVYNLPKDIKYDAVKDFFASEVGNVGAVSLQYNEKGQSKGIATVSFRNARAASQAVTKYNGAPIDGGAQKLRLELIIDPTKKPLASRIVANAKSVVAQKKKEQPKKANAKKATEQKKTEKKQKNKRPAKKTVEQLDQEMADYFEKKD